MSNSTTALEGEILLLNQLEIVTPTTVAGTLYGISFTLFCLYVHALVPRLQDQDRKRQARFMLVNSVVIMLCGLYSLVGNAWSAQDAYIKHSDYRGGPFIYEGTTFHTPLLIVGLTCQTAVTVLTSAIQIWRVWVIWSATRYTYGIIVVPSLCFLTMTALFLRTIILEGTLPIPQVRRLDLKTETAEVAIQVALTSLCTALISLFLVIQYYRQRKLMGKDQGSAGYLKIVAVLIESYALESIWLLMMVSLSERVVGAFFTESEHYIEILAYLLVQYRIASGTAYESQRGQSRMSSLHWNHSNRVTTQFAVTTDSGGGGDHYGSTKPEVSDEFKPVSNMA